MDPDRDWIWCQIGAREHYVVPVALHGAGRLRALITDAWASPHGILKHLPRGAGRRLAERGHRSLTDARIYHFTLSSLFLEAKLCLTARKDTWASILARNHWFQERAVHTLRASGLLKRRDRPEPVVFAYSYAALHILKEAKAQGCITLLGQIDGGPFEEDIVARAAARHPELRPKWRPAPQSYWESWREECFLADGIIVNSEWAREALTKQGIPPERICEIPLSYEPPETSESHSAHSYPTSFNDSRPLRVLFLGSLILRKGIAEVLAAVKILHNEPIVFWLVGQRGIDLPDPDRANAKVRWIGPVARSEVQAYYRDADLFLFPTLSDGFGLTQLEAQSSGLPVIASPRCGRVVEHLVSGILLEETSGPAIAEALRWCLANPVALREMSVSARSRTTRFRPSCILPKFLDCAGSARDVFKDATFMGRECVSP